MELVKQIYISFEGRLSRKYFWLGFLGLVVGAIILNLIVGLVTGGNAFTMAGANPAEFLNSGSPAEISEMLNQAVRASSWSAFIVTLIIAYPAVAIMIKRGKDRDMNLNLIYGYWVLVGLGLLAQISGLAFSTTTIGQFTVPTPSTIGWLLTVAQGLLGLYLLVVLGFLRGTIGDNQYGPDPVDAKSDEEMFDDAKLGD